MTGITEFVTRDGMENCTPDWDECGSFVWIRESEFSKSIPDPLMTAEEREEWDSVEPF